MRVDNVKYSYGVKTLQHLPKAQSRYDKSRNIMCEEENCRREFLLVHMLVPSHKLVLEYIFLLSFLPFNTSPHIFISSFLGCVHVSIALA